MKFKSVFVTHFVVAGKLFRERFLLIARDTFARKYPFIRYVLVENNNEKYQALKNRTSIFGEKFEVIQEDCNKVVDKIFSDYPDHNLVFIDNEGFDVDWKSVETILKAKADIIINYPTSMFERVARDPKSSNKLDGFFGDDSWCLARFDRKYSVKIYMNKLTEAYARIKKEVTLRDIQAYVSNIRLGTESFFYDIILVCKEGEYTRFWKQLRSDWNQKNCNCLIDFINDKTPCLDWFEGFSQEVEALDRKDKKRMKLPKDPNTLEKYFWG